MKNSNTAERLKNIMRTRNLKQVDILELSKPFFKKYQTTIKRNDLSQYVNGKTEPKQKKLMILANALNVSPTWLMGFDEDESTIQNSLISTKITNYSLEEIKRKILNDKEKYIKLLSKNDLEYILTQILFPETQWITNKYIESYINFINYYSENSIKEKYLYNIKYNYMLCIFIAECSKDEIINELSKKDKYKDFCSFPQKRKELIEQYFIKNKKLFIDSINSTQNNDEIVEGSEK